MEAIGRVVDEQRTAGFGLALAIGLDAARPLTRVACAVGISLAMEAERTGIAAAAAVQIGLVTVAGVVAARWRLTRLVRADGAFAIAPHRTVLVGRARRAIAAAA